ncbi:MAG TPA: hypothetical protein VGM67_17905 [Gemmatimonadaceae bacterium]|jgi:hypothetical protein
MTSSGDGSAGDGLRGDGAGDGADVVEHMRRAVRAAAEGAGSPADLQEAARQLVAHLKQDRARPEQMLLRIKGILAEAGIQPAYTQDSEHTVFISTPESVYRNVIAWSIRHYYAESDGDGAG